MPCKGFRTELLVTPPTVTFPQAFDLRLAELLMTDAIHLFSQSARADNTHLSFERQFFPPVQNHFLSVNSRLVLLVPVILQLWLSERNLCAVYFRICVLFISESVFCVFQNLCSVYFRICVLCISELICVLCVSEFVFCVFQYLCAEYFRIWVLWISEFVCCAFQNLCSVCLRTYVLCISDNLPRQH